jgi:hypothetical protein
MLVNLKELSEIFLKEPEPVVLVLYFSMKSMLLPLKDHLLLMLRTEFYANYLMKWTELKA